MKNKILLAAPNSYYKNYCWNDWLDRARSFGCDIFIGDNSEDNKNRKLYVKHGINYAWTNPIGKSSFQFICESQNQIRDYFLSKDYTHLFFLETDLLPPRQILDIFECADLPVISAPYFIYKGRETAPMNQEIRQFDHIDEALTRNYSLRESFIFQDGNFHRCFSSGFGCCLIKREVIEKVKFRWIGDSLVKEDPTGGSHPDSYFYCDIHRLRIPAYMYTGLTIKHYNQDWHKVNEKIASK